MILRRRRATGLIVFGILAASLCAVSREGNSWLRTRYAVLAGTTVAWRNGYEVRRDIVYQRWPGRDLRLDLYRPRARRAVPVVVFFHGGGWYEGSKEDASLLIQPYVRKGFAVANVEYRLSGEARAPAAVVDARCAARWVTANANEHLLDPNRVVAVGVSSGGHLAVMAALLRPIDGLDEGCTASGDGRVAAAVNWFGPTDLEALRRHEPARGFVEAWLGPRRDVSRGDSLSPISHVRKDGPFILTLHGDHDQLIPLDQARRLHSALNRVGQPSRLVEVPGAGHGFSEETMAAQLERSFSELRARGLTP